MDRRSPTRLLCRRVDDVTIMKTEYDVGSQKSTRALLPRTKQPSEGLCSADELVMDGLRTRSTGDWGRGEGGYWFGPQLISGMVVNV